MKIKNSDLVEFVEILEIEKQDKIFVKNGLKKMIDEININYDETVKKAQKNLEKAQKRYEVELQQSKQKVLESNAFKIMDMFGIETRKIQKLSNLDEQ